jgi:hypothetical protein
VDASVNATGADGAGIGAGYGDHGHSHVVELRISGGSVTASGTNGAGIGAGYGKTATGRSGVSALVIESGTITATTTNAAGIGMGYAADGASYVDALSIVQGTITTAGWAGIVASRMTLGGAGRVRSLTLYCSPTAPWCISGEKLTIDDASHSAWTDSPTFIAAAVTEMRLFDLVGQYHAASEADQFTNITAIHIGNIDTTGSGRGELVFREGSYSRTVPIRLGIVKGVIVALSRTGNFALTLDGRALCHSGGSAFPVADRVNFFPGAALCAHDGHDSGFTPSMQLIVGSAVGAVAIALGVVIVVVAVRRRRAQGREKESIGLQSASGAGGTVSTYTA